MTPLAPLLEQYFITHLISALNASAHTIAAYRDTWRLLIAFTTKATGSTPDLLQVDQLTSEHIGAFLNYLENERGNSISTRNARLAAIHSFFAYASFRLPEHANLIGRVLAIPVKRHHRTDISYLTEEEVQALLAAPDRQTWTGRRDHALMLTAITTGMRVAELTGSTWDDVYLGTGAHTRCHGKGRRERDTPLDKNTAAVLQIWQREQNPAGTTPVFPTRTARHMSTDAVAQRLTLHALTAARHCPTIEGKRLTPHTLRHTTAMRMLRAGIDTSVIALWLGHASAETTMIYLHADLSLKETALARTRPPDTAPGRFKPHPGLLAFLEAL